MTQINIDFTERLTCAGCWFHSTRNLLHNTTSLFLPHVLLTKIAATRILLPSFVRLGTHYSIIDFRNKNTLSVEIQNAPYKRKYDF
mmetsp:Transcript_6826/g.15599  ORF Transcript_6826/g.15599 Transcript_6826/m.15599 type:complete len:86 (+) Transcript_6826:786-1043(+)